MVSRVLGGVGRRVGRGASWNRLWALSDQVASSLSNVLAVVLVARTLDESGFGRFSIGYAVLVAALGISRSWFGTRLSLVPRPEEVPAQARAVQGALLVLAPLLAAAVFGLTWAVTGRSDLMVVVIAVAAPVVCLQDALRFAAVAAGRAGVALVSDGVWLAVLVGALAVQARLSATGVLVVWLVAGVLALLVGAAGLRSVPDLRAGWVTLRTRHTTSESLSFGTVVTLGASLAVVSTVGAVLSEASAGSLRGASTLAGPLNVLMAFVNLALTPYLVRRSRSGDGRFCLAVAGAMVLAVAAWAALVLSLPADWGRALLGQSWDGTRRVVAFTAVEYAALAVATAWVLGLKVRQEARQLAVQKAVVAVTTVVAGCGAAVLLEDVRWVALALAASACVGAALGAANLRTSLRRPATS